LRLRGSAGEVVHFVGVKAWPGRGVCSVIDVPREDATEEIGRLIRSPSFCLSLGSREHFRYVTIPTEAKISEVIGCIVDDARTICVRKEGITKYLVRSKPRWASMTDPHFAACCRRC
jgi:hypothetical protein